MTYHAPGSGDNPRPATLQNTEPEFDGTNIANPIEQYHYTLLENPTSPHLTQYFKDAILHTIKQALADPNPKPQTLNPDLRGLAHPTDKQTHLNELDKTDPIYTTPLPTTQQLFQNLYKNTITTNTGPSHNNLRNTIS